MMTLTLHCVEDNEVAADQHPFAPNPYPRDAFEQLRTFITEPTSNIREFEGAETASWIDVKLQRLLDHARIKLEGD